MTPERAALRDAINAHKDALEQVASAKATLKKALDLASDLASKAAEFDDLDSEMAQARAAQMKLCLASGDDHFPPFDDADFASRLVARDSITARQLQVRDTIPVLEKELADSEKAAIDCDFARERAAEKVLIVETERRAITHLAQIAALRREHYAITALATRYVRHPPTFNSAGQLGDISQRRAQMPGSVHGVAMENILGDFEARGGMKVRSDMGLAAQAYWQALKENPDTEFADFEPHDDAQRQAAE